MRIYLDVAPASVADWQQAGRAVKGLEWAETRESGEGCVSDQCPGSSVECPEGPSLLVGSLPELAEAKSAGWDAACHVATPQRFSAELQAVKRSCEAGELGELALLRAHHWLPGPVDAATRQATLLGAVDVALWLFGAVPQTVYGLQQEAGGGLQVHLGFSGNGMALMDFAWDLPAGGDYESLHVIGDRGAAYADDHHNVSLLYGGEEPRALRVDTVEAARVGLLQALVGQGKDLATLSDIRTAHDVCAAVEQSIAAKQAVAFAKGNQPGGGA